MHDTGPAWALAALGLGATASALTVELTRGSIWDAEHEPDPEAVYQAASPEEASHLDDGEGGGGHGRGVAVQGHGGGGGGEYPGGRCAQGEALRGLAQVGGDAQAAPVHHEPAALVVVIGADPVQTRVGQLRPGPAQRDQLAIPVQYGR